MLRTWLSTRARRLATRAARDARYIN